MATVRARPKRLTAAEHETINETYRERGREIARRLISGDLTIWQYNSLRRVGMMDYTGDAIIETLVTRARQNMVDSV